MVSFSPYTYFRSLVQDPFALLTSALATSCVTTRGNVPSCPIDTPWSCSNDTVVGDLCCFEYPGGVVLQTQFWDYNPAIGPDDKWTVHGLWPDNCDGSFEQFCDTSLEVEDVAAIIEQHDPELLKEMHGLWKDFRGNDANLWKHEWNKHGTCYTTLKPACYGGSIERSKNVFDYFNITMNLYRQLPTYDWLADAGIVPSETKTYSKEEILAVLKEKSDAEPYIRCDYKNALQEVWYFHHLKGSLLGENFTPIDTLTNSRCGATGIRYMPKGSSITTSLSPTRTYPQPQPTGDTNAGFLVLSGQPGCLIKSGKWYVSGTCATYRLTQLSTGSYTLKNNAGLCTLKENTFHCGTDVKSPFEFDYDKESKVFSANGVDTFSADKVPTRFEQVDINRGPGNVEFQLRWKPRW